MWGKATYRYHFFAHNSHVSLCGCWLREYEVQPEADGSPENCRTCERLRARQQPSGDRADRCAYCGRFVAKSEQSILCRQCIEVERQRVATEPEEALSRA